MVNPAGRNQYGPKDYPSDEVLKEVFREYAKEKGGSGLTAKEQLGRLKKELNLLISERQLYKLRKRLEVPSIRKSSSKPQELAQAVIDIKDSDLTGRWGVAQVRQRLANNGILIRRDECRSVLHDHFDDEFDQRFVGCKGKIIRTPLNCLGPWHQVHCDGHEKLNSQALQMGTVTLPIYGFKDQFSAFVPLLQVLPSVRNVETIGHLYLDLVESYGRAPLQLVMDKGTEVGDMIRAQQFLRVNVAPEYSEDNWPSTVQVQSKKNTPIEGFWRWKRNGEGHNIRSAIITGRENGLFNSNNPLHVNVFNWLWPPLVQSRLHEFREYWNNHLLSKQKKKVLPSGTSPRQMWLDPQSVRADARDCSIVANMNIVRQLREGLGGTEGRAQAYAFVDPEFGALADSALGELNFPAITLMNAWDIFIAVVEILSSESV
ncbi:Transposase [Pleurotus pulmonarius]|nr:hypothetical protein EYR38_010717 [Pleurotus pulmonarius]